MILLTAMGSPLIALALLAGLAAPAPPPPSPAAAKVEALLEVGLVQTAIATGRVAERTAKHSIDVDVALAHALLEADQLAAARLACEVALAKDVTHKPARALLRAVLRRQGDTAALLADFARLRAHGPFDALEQIAEAKLLGITDGSGALKLLDDALSKGPKDSRIWRARGNLRGRLGAPESARADWAQSLRLAPRQPRLAALLGAPTLEDWLIDLEQLVADAGPVSPTGARTLLDQTIVALHEDGLSTTLRQLAMRVDAQWMARGLSVHPISFSPTRERLTVIQAEVRGRDGARRPAEHDAQATPEASEAGIYTDGFVRQIDFGKLRPGEVIHVVWRIDEIPGKGLYGRSFGHNFAAQSTAPVDRFRVVVTAPKTTPIYTATHGLPPPEEGEVDARRRWVWSARNLPAAPIESDERGWAVRTAGLSVSRFKTWDEIADWYRELMREAAVMTPALEGIFVEAKLTAEMAPDEVVDRLFAVVSRKVRYVSISLGVHGFRPHVAKAVWRRGYGDCKDKATLLVTLLRARGIGAELVLTRTMLLGDIDTTVPQPGLFDHATVYVPSLNRFLDPTDESGDAHTLPTMDQGALGLRVHAEKGGTLGPLPITPADRNRSTVDARLELHADGKLDIQMRFEATDVSGANLRMAFQGADRTARDLEQGWAARWPGLEVRSAEADLDPLHPVTAMVTAAMDVPHWLEGAPVPLSPQPFALVNDHARTAERKHPLAIAPLGVERRTTTLTLPPGRRFEAPADVQIDSPFGGYTRRSSRLGQTWQTTTELRLSAASIQPADYPAFRRFCQQVDAAARAMGRIR